LFTAYSFDVVAADDAHIGGLTSRRGTSLWITAFSSTSNRGVVPAARRVPAVGAHAAAPGVVVGGALEPAQLLA